MRRTHLGQEDHSATLSARLVEAFLIRSSIVGFQVPDGPENPDVETLFAGAGARYKEQPQPASLRDPRAGPASYGPFLIG